MSDIANDDDLPSFLTTTRVAEIFSVTTETIRDWITDGKLPGAIQVGRVWRIPRAAVQELAKGKVG